jgi:peptidyl-dipeptidase Dcp
MTLYSTTLPEPSAVTSTDESSNPLLRPWTSEPFHLPPFKSIEPHHFEPAFEIGMASHLRDLEAIASSEEDSFDSILAAYDRAGAELSKIYSVYGNYISSLNTPDMQEVQSKMAPLLSRHTSATYNVPGLFEKVSKMNDVRVEKVESGEWTAEMGRLAERVYIKFVRMGALLGEKERAEYADIQGKFAGAVGCTSCVLCLQSIERGVALLFCTHLTHESLHNSFDCS